MKWNISQVQVLFLRTMFNVQTTEYTEDQQFTFWRAADAIASVVNTKVSMAVHSFSKSFML
jgi:hypothetical protein